MADSGNIKVVVRCRPLNSRERNRGASNLIEVVDQHQLVLNPPGEGDSRENARATKKKAMPFSFDRSYGEDTEQHELFDYVGEELLQHSFNGFNTCVFAYGQTGSGKSHSMVGYAEAKGLIPLTCSKLFVDANKMLSEDSNLSITVEVSYIEIYNEKVRDLLNPKNKGNLRVREHPSLGPYVEDLSKLVVKDFNDIENLMDEGNKARTVAATNMNETSSRSHAVFTLVVTQKRKDVQTNLETEKVSRISLVDLAGSERANSTGATGSRLKEGANINRSLTTLGKVIAALAQASAEPAKGKKKVALENFVPYRDSVLTWLLKDSLGGNSKTAMIAAISPADYEETLSTLRYADQAKKIKNKAVVNEDPNAKLIRELKEELEMLRNRVQLGGGGDGEGTWDPSIPPEKQVVRYLTKSGEVKTVTKAELQDQLEQSEKIMESLNQSWEQKVAQTRAIQIEREKALEELGITVDKGNVGVHTPKSLPHLVNLNEDPLMSECLIYQLKPGSTSVTNVDSADTHEGVGAQIRLSGDSILPDHCTFENLDGVVTLQTKTESHTMVNGKKVTPEEPRRLRSGYRIILGEDFRHVFRFNHPEEVRKARDRIRLASVNGDETQGDLSGNVTRSDSPVSDANEGNVDWTYARREAALAAVHGHDVNFDALNEEDLEKLYEDIMKARSKKIGGTWRSESRLSSFDDNASETNSSELRPYSMSAYTDDTSLDPWGINADYDTPSFVPSASTPEPDQETQETIDLRKQVKDYQDQITKLQNVTSLDLPANYSRREKRLLRLALSKWRKQTSVTMAEDILQYAILLKEANVISRELRKNTTYQFAIVDEGELANPTSNLEAIVGLSEFDDVADTQLAHAPKPSVCVKVIDHKHKTVYLWSIGKLEQRLQKMRNLYGFIDRPEYGQHFNWSDPFYEDASNPFSFVGNALIPLTPLYRMVSATYADVPIFSRHTHAKIGACNVELRFVNVTTSSGQVGDGQGSGSNTNAELCVGQKLGFQLSVSTCRGLSRAEFEQVHIQIHTSAIAGEKNTEVLTSAACASDKDLKLRKTVAIVLDSSSIERLRGGYLPIEFFAKVNDAHMKGLEKYDADREAHRSIGQSPREEAKIYQNGNGDIERPELTVKSTSSGRLSEKEMVLEERHDILASVQICELSSAGTYKPVQVRSTSSLDPGAFYLRQGLQRKIVVQLRHESGQQFPWSSVTNLMLNNVRMLDNKGKMHTSTGEDITLNVPLKQQTLAFHGNGTTDLEAWAWWDSSMHDSIFLNRTTAANNRILLRLTCKIAVESCIEPVSLTMDIAVAIHGRDAKPPGKLYTMFESATLGSRVLMKSANVFAIRLTPPMTKKSQELWRLDTATKYVRGQEALEGIWKPRGVSLIHEYERFVTTERRAAEVRGVRALLDVNPPLSLLSEGSVRGLQKDVEHQRALLLRSVEAWQALVERSKASVLQREMEDSRTSKIPGQNGDKSKSDNGSVQGASASETKSEMAIKLKATATLVPRTDAANKRGHLTMPVEAFSDAWIRRWFVLKRPYLFVYENSSELDELMVIHLGAVRVEHDTNIESMLNRQNVFGLYTASNSYFLQAATETEMQQWMNSLSIRR
jgi:kinesin family protein 1